jgi:hypothetical protein
MKKVMVVLMALTVFVATVPAYAMEHGGSHDPADVQCAKDCDMLLKNCSQDVDSIQQKIEKLKAAIKKDGADQQKVAEVKALKLKLDDANAMFEHLGKGGH